MAYDEQLAQRIRVVLDEVPGVVEKKMFGGLSFLLGGNMVVAASGKGGLMVRADPERYDMLVARDHSSPFEMHGRGLNGWLYIDPKGLASDEQLAEWVDEALEYVRILPPKPPTA